eukprot:300643_1
MEELLSAAFAYCHSSGGRAAMYERRIKKNPKDFEAHGEYAYALMSLDDKHSGLKHLKIYWNSVPHNLESMEVVIKSLNEGGFYKMAAKYCKMAYNLIVIDDKIDDNKKAMIFIHYANNFFFRSKYKKTTQLLNKLSNLLKCTTDNSIGLGRMYQHRLQLASNYLNLNVYSRAYENIQYCMQFKNVTQFTDTNDSLAGFCRLQSKFTEKVSRIYATICRALYMYKVSKNYFMKAMTQYNVYRHLIKCNIELGNYDEAYKYFSLAMDEAKKEPQRMRYDMAECTGLLLYLYLHMGKFNDVEIYLQYLMVNQNNICPRALFYVGYYLHYYRSDNYQALKFYLVSFHTCQEIFPECYYHFAVCSYDIGSLLLSRQYLCKAMNMVNFVENNCYKECKTFMSKLEGNVNKLKCGNELCNTKFTKRKLKICTGCGIDVYCSKKCQKIAWNKYRHGAKCSGLFSSIYEEIKIFNLKRKTKKKIAMLCTENKRQLSCKEANELFLLQARKAFHIHNS